MKQIHQTNKKEAHTKQNLIKKKQARNNATNKTTKQKQDQNIKDDKKKHKQKHKTTNNTQQHQERISKRKHGCAEPNARQTRTTRKKDRTYTTQIPSHEHNFIKKKQKTNKTQRRNKQCIIDT